MTQPRRVATVSTARRVAEEMGFGWESENHNSHNGEVVGYQIRHDTSTVGPKTAIKFMTDGILLKEVSTDLLLRKYSVIFLDEAHERNVNTDVLIGMLSRSFFLCLPRPQLSSILDQFHFAESSPKKNKSVG